jgi:hypothetical protein
MADDQQDDLDELYWVKPEDFTATRSRLTAQAKERGDAKSAKQISASRKSTMAAWAVNRLALSRRKTTCRLTQLGERLRAAHTAMDGEQIRELSAEQRRLIDELSQTAFDAAEMPDPSAALREEVTATLQAAIADPDVAARLGRLTKAERWSGFGDFGVTAPVSATARTTEKPEKPQKPEKPAKPQKPVAQLESARAVLAEAQRAKAEADAAQNERHTELVSARWRHQEARKRLDAAERELHAAEQAHDKATQTSRAAAELVKEAKARLAQTRTQRS